MKQLRAGHRLSPEEGGFMARNRTYWMPTGRKVFTHPDPEVVATNLRRELSQAFGRPVFRDDTILVYRVRPARR